MNTDTPRTDAEAMYEQDGKRKYDNKVSSDFARQLERELNRQKEINRLEEEHRLAVESVRDELQNKYGQLRADLHKIGMLLGAGEDHPEDVANHAANIIPKLRAEVERLKESSVNWEQLHLEMAKQRNQWREDAERLATCLTHSVVPTGPMLFVYCEENKQALAAHKRLVQEAKK